jgi:hypothetical protein
MSKPITPREAKTASINNIPSFVIDAFNKLIVANMQGRYSTIKQDDVVAEISKAIDRSDNASPGFVRDQVFKNKWLDVEDLYKKAGWSVYYDKPAYNESYPATFSFTAPVGFDACIDIIA